jgi:hypothetical protein
MVVADANQLLRRLQRRGTLVDIMRLPNSYRQRPLSRPLDTQKNTVRAELCDQQSVLCLSQCCQASQDCHLRAGQGTITALEASACADLGPVAGAFWQVGEGP